MRATPYTYATSSPCARFDPLGTDDAAAFKALGAAIRMLKESGPQWAKDAIAVVDGEDGGGFHIDGALGMSPGGWLEWQGLFGTTFFPDWFREIFEDFPQVYINRETCQAGDDRIKWQTLLMALLHELVHVAQNGREGHPIAAPIEEPDPRDPANMAREDARNDEWNNQMWKIAGKVMKDQEKRPGAVPWKKASE